jgi:hypothetical protein
MPGMKLLARRRRIDDLKVIQFKRRLKVCKELVVLPASLSMQDASYLRSYTGRENPPVGRTSLMGLSNNRIPFFQSIRATLYPKIVLSFPCLNSWDR